MFPHRCITAHVAMTAAVLAVLGLGAERAKAQTVSFPVQGTVRTAAGIPVPAAVVSVEGGVERETDQAGRFELRLPRGRHVLHISDSTHVPVTREIDVTGPVDNLDMVLEDLLRFSEEVTVAAVRAGAEAPVTKADLDRHEIEALNGGQEMPFLLKQVPSLTQYSDSGGTTGYSYIYLRGIQQTRMNVTFDGIPLNEPEDSAFYFANFGDFASAVDSIQIQRGVGTSTVGAASFVGSINFASVDIKDRPEATVRVGAGSFGARRMSAALHSGDIGQGVKLYGQVAYQEGDGFRRNSGNIQQSVYVGATRGTPRSFFKLFGAFGRERSHLAFLAADEDTLNRDLRFNPMFPDERDDFGQGFLTAQYHHTLGASSEISVQGYYNGAGGWYRIRDAGAEPTGLLQYGLHWRSVGAMTTYRLTHNAWSLTWGTHVNDFGSRHERETVDGPPDYTNRGFKNEVNTFAKLGYAVGRWHHYGDVQFRWARFRYQGSPELGQVSWTFANPKIGTRFDVTPVVSLYASLGRASREPGRSDLLQGEDNPTLPYDLHAVRPETVTDFETGAEFRRGSLSAQTTLYLMEFRHEIALTGELSEIGLPTRRNVDRSFRRGVEVDLTWRPWTSLRLRHTASYSYNRIRRWTQFYDMYDADGQWIGSTAMAHANVAPLLTPAVLGTLSAEYAPAGWLAAGTSARYVGRSYLDNTGSDRFTAPAFAEVDASVSFDLSRAVRFAEPARPRIRIAVTNLLNNTRMFPGGYSYQYLAPDATGSFALTGTRYFYPLGTRSVLVMLDLTP